MQALRETILELGRQRFAKAASRKQRAQLEAVTALPYLERVRDRILSAASWADLLVTPEFRHGPPTRPRTSSGEHGFGGSERTQVAVP